MASIIIMPKQGLLMEEGTLTNWLYNEGDTVKENEPLFEMETDKLTITMDSTASGTLLKILHPVGDTVPITQPIAIVGEPGEDISALLSGETETETAASAKEETPAVEENKAAEPVPAAPAEPKRHEGRIFASPRARMRAGEKEVDLALIDGTGTDGMIIERDIISYVNNRPKTTSAARKIAEEEKIDLSGIEGTGLGGRITSSDLLESSGKKENAVPAAGRGERRVPMTGMRKAISRNMRKSLETCAQTELFVEISMENVIELRNRWKASGVKVSYNDIIIKAVARALMEHPVVNASVGENEIIYHEYANIGLAVDSGDGLLVPVVKDADLKNVKEIAADTASYVEKAREGKLRPEDMSGGTFTVSSLGMFGIDRFISIINVPESAILSVGRIAKKPVVVTGKDGKDEIVIRQICEFGLSFDHRIIDGARAAEFLQSLREYLEYPALLI